MADIEDAKLVVELAKWGTMSGMEAAGRLIMAEDFDPDLRPREGIGWYLYQSSDGADPGVPVVLDAEFVERARRVAALRREIEAEERRLQEDLKQVFAPVVRAPDGVVGE